MFSQRRRKYYALLAAGFAALLASLLGLAVGSMLLLSAVRAYVTGEGFWSKAQKDAVLHLRRYGQSRDPADFELYLIAIRVPQADHEARLELEKPNANLRVAREAFVRGRNHPDDALGMCLLFRWFWREQHLSRAIDYWRQADENIGRVQQLASELRTAVESNGSLVRSPADILAEIDRVYEILTPIEDGFSQTLGAGARATQSYVTYTLIAGTLIIFAAGLLVARVLMRRLRQSEEQYRSFLDTAGDAILLSDPGTQRILEANGTACARTGLGREELIGRRLDEVVQISPAGDLVIGANILVDVRSTAARVGATEIIVSIVRDVTEQRVFQRRTEEAARLESIGRLADVIAHDFRTQLAAIMIYASDLKLEARDQLMVHGFDQILRSARNGADLVDSLMAFSRGQPTRYQIVDLNDVATEATDFLRRIIGESIELHVEFAGTSLPIMAERSRLKQALVNLSANARDAMPNGGDLSIRTTFVPGGVAADGSGRVAEKDSALLTVKDTGMGMDPHTCEHAFDPFFTTKRNGKGTGLGLWSVFLAVRQSQGDVWITSEIGRGTTVSVLLPLVRPTTLHELGSTTASLSHQPVQR